MSPNEIEERNQAREQLAKLLAENHESPTPDLANMDAWANQCGQAGMLGKHRRALTQFIQDNQIVGTRKAKSIAKAIEKQDAAIRDIDREMEVVLQPLREKKAAAVATLNATKAEASMVELAQKRIDATKNNKIVSRAFELLNS